MSISPIAVIDVETTGLFPFRHDRIIEVAAVVVEVMLSEAAAMLSEIHLRPSKAPTIQPTLVGLHVCFTGELQCQRSEQSISRALAEELATNAGLVVVDAVTKKCDLLVLADPQSQSGKAKRARQYGIRIMHEPVFWKAIGVSVT